MGNAHVRAQVSAIMTAKFFAAVQKLVKRENPFRVPSQGLAPPPTIKAEEGPTVGSDIIRVEPGTSDHAWIVSWDAIPAVGGYEYQTNLDHRRFDLWSSRVRTDAPRVMFTLPAGTLRCWVRVRAITLRGPGPWSDPVL